MKKTLLASAVLFALSGPSMGADFIHEDTIEHDHGALDLSAPPSDFDNTPSYYDEIKIETAAKGLRGNVGEKNNSYLLKVNKSLTVSSANNSGIFLCDHSDGNHDFVIEAPEILIENVGDNSGIHMDSNNSSITVQKFEKFTIDATGPGKWGFYEGNGLRVNRNGSSIELDGKSIKITAGQSGAVVTSNGSITLSADSIEITSWGHGASNSKKPYKGQGVTVTGGGKISLKAKDEIIIKNENEKGYDTANAVLVSNGSVEIDSLQPSAQKPVVTVKGKITLNGEQAKLVINSNDATAIGDIDAANGEFQLDGNLTFKGNEAEIANLTGNKATFMITDANQVVSIKNSNKELTVAATGEVNDKAGIKALEGIVSGDTNGVQLVAYEGMNSKGTTATLDKDGNLTNIVETTNSIMSNSLDLTSAAPLAMNRLLMNDVRKRMGDLRAAEGTHGVWARYDGGKLSGERGLENDFTTVQVGIDTVPVVDAPRFGVAFAYTKSDADMMRGSAEMDAFSLAFYGTKFYDNGMFVDVIGRMATADTDITVDGDKKGSMDNVALSLSGEMGWRFDVTEKFYFEPQAELTYTYVNADKLDLSGTTYEFDSVDSLMARVGFAAGFKCPSNYGDVYVRASAMHEFLGDTAVMSGKNIHEVDGEDTWVEFGIGAQFNVNKNTYVYADIERTEGAKLEEDWRANVGVRYAF